MVLHVYVPIGYVELVYQVHLDDGHPDFRVNYSGKLSLYLLHVYLFE